MNKETLIGRLRFMRMGGPSPAPFDPVCQEAADLLSVSSTDLTFKHFSEVNKARCARWHPGFPDDDDWTIADWSNAMCGEAGEAANVAKKIRRIETGIRGAVDPDESVLNEKLGDELADVFCYLDLLATKRGINFPAALVRKFDAISDRERLPEKLGDSPPLYTWETVPIGHDVPGSGIVKEKRLAGNGRLYVTFDRYTPFAEVWTSGKTSTDPVPTALKGGRLVYS